MDAKPFDAEARDVYRGDLTGFLRSVGAESVEAFLHRVPGLSLVELACRYPGSGLSAAAIRRAQMREAAQLGAIRRAAMDCLVRDINESFPDGWGNGDLLSIRTAGPVVWLLTALELDANAPHLAPAARRTWDALLASRPPAGWKPLSIDDPLIQDAFDRGWPEGDGGIHSTCRSGS